MLLSTREVPLDLKATATAGYEMLEFIFPSYMDVLSNVSPIDIRNAIMIAYTESKRTTDEFDDEEL